MTSCRCVSPQSKPVEITKARCLDQAQPDAKDNFNDDQLSET